MIVESYEDVIVLSGALRSNFWETIHTAISLMLSRHPSGIIIDCSGITECTNEGAATFIDAMEYIEEHDARIIVAAVPKNVLEVLKSVPEVRSQLPIVGSVEEARRSLDLLPAKTKKKVAEKQVTKHHVVCLTGEPSDEYLVRNVQELLDDRQVKLHFVFPIVVPRELPLQAPLPEEEEVAKATFERASAHLENSISYDFRIERARDISGALQATLEEVNAIQVLIALPAQEEVDDKTLKLIRSVLTKVKKTVLMIRGPLA